jgi:phospholipid-transporting ATPase
LGLGNTQVEWADVVVGDLVRVKNWQPFPSDLLLISSSSADGQCYIETSNLDGYTSFPIILVIIVKIRSRF